MCTMYSGGLWFTVVARMSGSLNPCTAQNSRNNPETISPVLVTSPGTLD
jgi:hypothetical protein